jgi:bifunctional DNase/RNase
VDRIKLEILGLSSSQSQSGSFALVLGEKPGKRRLPIIIGMFEAQAIAIEIEKIIPNRPMTHDLFKSFAGSFNYSVKEIVISDLKEGVFFAKIVCTDETKTIEIDSRPSDAIAIGLRFNAPIYTFETILSEAGVELSEGEVEEEPDVKKELEQIKPKKKTSPYGSSEKIKDTKMEKLKEMLDQAIEQEDYEKAAKIRDEINKRN